MFGQLFLIVAFVGVSLTSPVKERGGRIVGGFNAAPNQFPYQASLQTPRNSHFCGASIINNRWVLSAAHCTVQTPQNGIRILVGTNFLNSGGVRHTSSRIINHPNYDPHSLFNDISVVQTATVITFNAATSHLPLGSTQIGAVNAVVSGWGDTTAAGAWSNHMQGLNLRTITNADCQNRFPASERPYIIGQKLCTMTPVGQGICYGDSGSPLVVGGAAVGVVSWGISCAIGWPDVYIRVAPFRSWILNSIGG